MGMNSALDQRRCIPFVRRFNLVGVLVLVRSNSLGGHDWGIGIEGHAYCVHWLLLMLVWDIF
jgi:hypothetical protein